ncbi:MAG: Eco57I restriction-modification methylase domain-containing protein [Spirochaetes bacterium]|nr:Eco57I restriction-modification methylase domain-containing protein [Spirochaetota bacterium]
MDKQQAQRIIKDTFEHPFNKKDFILFVKNLLNRVDSAPFTYKGNYIPDAYKQYIKTMERLGKYSDGKSSIDILVVTLKKETSLERARTKQRNFVAWYLNGSRGGIKKDAALAAFVSPDKGDWRFSLVKMDYTFEKTESGRMRVKEEFTPARRWSFLVGVNEKSHTAQSRLVDILANDESDPSLEDIGKAFDIETVTREFFLKYRDLFLRTKEELDRIVQTDPKVEADFKAKGVDTVNFAKKLLGQIIFLYFLQKKGWFGVGRDDDWGTGSKQFLRELFEKKHGDYKNFFNGVLEHLFYDALRDDRSHNDYYFSQFNCKIPFLNGGLFDPIGNYDWVHTDINLPDTLFSNSVKTKEGDKGDGILDIFDRYNFTVKEDEPLEKEVAIDPELLGKAYEKFNAIRPDNYPEFKNALKSGKKGAENEFNKKFGVYYTPREIVHYMCRQCLVNYLARELSADVGKSDIEILIQSGEQVSENEARVLREGRETKTYSFKLPENVRKNAALIDDTLAMITVCDPAVGSGAFPVGMMSEIVRARNVLSTFMHDNSRTSYEFKRRCIEHSLYGVDIDPGAVEIAKLRLWLSLVVDEDDIKTIKPLPNLDYKIVRGDSLRGVENHLFNDHLFAELEKVKPLFFEETNPTKKCDYKNRIHDLIGRITSGHTEFDFTVYFSEIFHETGGFDVVIANPPYVRQEAIRSIKPQLKDAFKDFYCGTADLYTYFYKCGIDILKRGGHLCFIAPNKFMRAGYGKNTRDLLTTAVTPKLVIDFGDLPVFEATTYPSIILVEKKKPDPGEEAAVAAFTDPGHLDRIDEDLETIRFRMPVSSLDPKGWNLERPEALALMEKLRSSGVSLGEYVKGRFFYGIKTGFNEAFVIDQECRDRLITEDPNSAEIIKPWLRGRDIRKWKTEWAGLYLINIPSSANKQWYWSREESKQEAARMFEKTFPAVYRHLVPWKEKLQKREDQGKFWWELRSCAYYKEFERPKIVYADIAQSPNFTWDESNAFLGNTAYIIPTNEIWLTGLFNSTVFWWYFQNISSIIRGGFVRFFAQYMETIPIPSLPNEQKTALTELTRSIHSNPDSPGVLRLEKEINGLVYTLYGLTAEEIEIVER